MCRQNEERMVVLTYDLDTSWDANVNTEIKEYLKDLDWNDAVLDDYPAIRNRFEEEKSPLPSTTLVKQGIDLDEAKTDFISAKVRYNVTHATDYPTPKTAQHTRAIAFMVNDYLVFLRSSRVISSLSRDLFTSVTWKDRGENFRRRREKFRT